jgi:pimeloyl-ACP methyl ester carboxylesterase
MRRASILVALCSAVCAAGAAPGTAPASRPVAIGKIRIWKIAYRAHDGVRRNAYVALPRSYRPGHDPPIPLVISPHGRGITGRANVNLWGQLPAVGNFAVISPDGQGRKLANYSWGSEGQISDLARMPQILQATLPWVHIAPHRVYAFGGSMGGQETLLLLARHPHLLAGAAAFDPVVDFALQYREFPKLRCAKNCRIIWHGPIGQSLQELARDEIGGPPGKVPFAYELRSPITYARAIAASGVPLQLWWSPRDKIVIDQQRQAARFLGMIRRLSPRANVVGFTGGWSHSAEMRAKTRLPLALATFGLLPRSYYRATGLRVLVPLSKEPSAVMYAPERRG